mmetsp:Transcript_34520/g.75346  ORF Transcript_34520/g.75346 Transcript_34520/m.75346 type:complete len:200 (-) Transcript_34520:16-615(-)
MAHNRAIPGLRQPSRSRPNGIRVRELEFCASAKTAPLPEYKPLLDVHLRQLWEQPRKRAGLRQAGFLDDGGELVDVDAQRRKISVIEQELAQADIADRERAYEKERLARERQVLAKRAENYDRHLRQVSQRREEDIRRRERLGLPGCREISAPGTAPPRCGRGVSPRAAGSAITGACRTPRSCGSSRGMTGLSNQNGWC